MKEIIAIIRMQKVNATKKALEEAGFPSLTCRKVLGRGKNLRVYEMAPWQTKPNSENKELKGAFVSVPAQISEMRTLMPKRLITMIIHDKDLQTVIDIIIKANCNGHSGDGKIFVINIDEAIGIRTGETGEAVI